MIDEEINVLFIGMLCLRTLEVHTVDVVKCSILTELSTLRLPSHWLRRWRCCLPVKY